MAPTVSTEAVFLTAVIDALENRDVAVLDVLGVFMQADIDELVHVRFTGEMVRDTFPSQKNHVLNPALVPRVIEWLRRY